MSIVILGLGPGAWDKMTLEAKQVLDDAEEVLLRTTQHPTAEHLPGHLRLSSFDRLYETNPNYEDIAQTIAAEVISLGKRPKGIIYAVPGHPLTGEPSVPLIISTARDEGIAVRIIDGLSFSEPDPAQEEHLKDFNTLIHIMATLRSPEGCPWDREQTHASLKPHLLQESYEVVEALDNNDLDKLCEELGDLLMQIAFHAQLASETGDFTMSDVLKSINTKLLRRHPHVFGDAKVADAAQVSHRWNEIKRGERDDDESLLASVPKLMPALMYSQTIQDRASGSGFDWENVEGVLDKLSEEINELMQAESPEEQAGEFGDVLFTLVNAARWLNLDAEDSLRQSNRRFYRRFQRMEDMCRRQDKMFAEMSIEEMDELWNEAKAAEGF